MPPYTQYNKAFFMLLKVGGRLKSVAVHKINKYNHLVWSYSSSDIFFGSEIAAVSMYAMNNRDLNSTECSKQS